MRSHIKKRKKLAECPSRKVCRTRYDAKQDLVKAANSRGSGSVISTIQSAYWCCQCDYWHLTRQLPWFNADDRQRNLIAPDVKPEKS